MATSNLRFKCTKRYATGWSDPRAVYGTRVRWWSRIDWTRVRDAVVDGLGMIIGTAIIVAPVAAVMWYVWRTMGWM